MSFRKLSQRKVMPITTGEQNIIIELCFEHGKVQCMNDELCVCSTEVMTIPRLGANLHINNLKTVQLGKNFSLAFDSLKL